jgi:uncharacterized protein (DUF2147 family)
MCKAWRSGHVTRRTAERMFVTSITGGFPMRRMFPVLVAAFAVVAFSSMTFAQAAAPAEKAAKPAAEKVVKKAAKPAAEKTEQAAATEKKIEKKAAAPVAVGKVAKFDAATKTLTVTTKKGDENFTLTADTKIMAGAKVAKEDDLAAGKNVKVAYTEANGQMTATKVTIAAAKAAKKAPATEKKDEPKAPVAK